MNWADLDKFDEYDRTLPCPNCKELAKPTVAGGNWKCNPCGHLFREDGTKPTMDCVCKKCAPEHDPLKGKTKGKKAELQLPEKKTKKEIKVKKQTKKQNPLKLICDNCGEINYAVVDGYEFGDTLLEGVKFAVTLKGKKYTAKPLLNRDEKYLDDLNKKKWLKAAAVHAEETDILECFKCHGEVMNPLFDEENYSDPVSVPISRIEDIFGK